MKRTEFARQIRNRVISAQMLLERFRDEIKAVAAIEFAFLAPVMLLMYVGTIEISAAMSANRKLSRVASTVGDLMTQMDCYTNADVNDILEIADEIMFPYNNALAITITGIQVTSSGGEVVWSRSNGGGGAPAGSPHAVPNGINTEGIFLVSASVSMSYAPATGWFFFQEREGKTGRLGKNTGAIEMSEELFLRPRIGNSVTVGGGC